MGVKLYFCSLTRVCSRLPACCCVIIHQCLCFAYVLYILQTSPPSLLIIPLDLIFLFWNFFQRCFLLALAVLTLHGGNPWSQTQHASSHHWPELSRVLHVCACVCVCECEWSPETSSRMEDLKENLGTLDWRPGITRGRPWTSSGFSWI